MKGKKSIPVILLMLLLFLFYSCGFFSSQYRLKGNVLELYSYNVALESCQLVVYLRR